MALRGGRECASWMVCWIKLFIMPTIFAGTKVLRGPGWRPSGPSLAECRVLNYACRADSAIPATSPRDCTENRHSHADDFGKSTDVRAMTGTSQAIASSATSPNDSSSLGSSKMSAIEGSVPYHSAYPEKNIFGNSMGILQAILLSAVPDRRLPSEVSRGTHAGPAKNHDILNPLHRSKIGNVY